jgi:hypothetical protein
MIVFGIISAALLVGLALALVIRPLVAAAIGIGLFIAAGAWQSTRPDDAPGEAINGAAGWMLATVWILLPWLVGVAIGSLIALWRTEATKRLSRNG